MSEEIRITILVENCVHQKGLQAEHGLAYHIVVGKQQVVFDTGQTDLLLANAQQLGLDLSQVDYIVLSHGHYDHTGGLAALRHLAPNARILMHPVAMAPKFAANLDGSSRPIGMSEATLSALATAQVDMCDEHPVEVVDGLFATGRIPRLTSLEDVGGRFFLDPTCSRPDPILDDQALFFESPAGTIVLLGCAHAGVINTLQHIESFTGSTKVASVLGGMHLLNASEERIRFTLEELRRRDIRELVPMHCTGWKATLRIGATSPEASGRAESEQSSATNVELDAIRHPLGWRGNDNKTSGPCCFQWNTECTGASTYLKVVRRAARKAARDETQSEATKILRPCWGAYTLWTFYRGLRCRFTPG